MSSPVPAKWFKGYNACQPREEQIRPGRFGLIAHPDPAVYKPDTEPGARRQPPGLPAAPYERKRERWTQLPWYDRATGSLLDVITAQATRRARTLRARHLTTVGTGRSFTGPPSKGKRSKPSPGGRGNAQLDL